MDCASLRHCLLLVQQAPSRFLRTPGPVRGHWHCGKLGCLDWPWHGLEARLLQRDFPDVVYHWLDTVLRHPGPFAILLGRRQEISGRTCKGKGALYFLLAWGATRGGSIQQHSYDALCGHCHRYCMRGFLTDDRQPFSCTRGPPCFADAGRLRKCLGSAWHISRGRGLRSLPLPLRLPHILKLVPDEGDSFNEHQAQFHPMGDDGELRRESIRLL
mmetsp:Transcript_95771/g.132878  ORF Transcript_95771/g.132878 Transcript_95771/m.132878 type:complete len:215 (-) Transcript_95771:531-1175(-)